MDADELKVPWARGHRCQSKTIADDLQDVKHRTWDRLLAEGMAELREALQEAEAEATRLKKTPVATPRTIQIAAVPGSGGRGTIYALRDDGSIWQKRWAELAATKWTRLADFPDAKGSP